jgi:hypothetical protein
MAAQALKLVKIRQISFLLDKFHPRNQSSSQFETLMISQQAKCNY